MRGPLRPRRLDQPIAVSLEDLEYARWRAVVGRQLASQQRTGEEISKCIVP